MTITTRPLVLVALGLAAVACGSGGSSSSTAGTGGSTSSTTGTGGSGTGGVGGAQGGSGGSGAAFNIDECANGTAQCDPNADCVDTPAYYTCVCKAGYQGDGKTCTDIDECQAFLADLRSQRGLHQPSG
ncbi:MAG: calcium-binding EGF-like domain-containing protein [Minicystis sp.]